MTRFTTIVLMSLAIFTGACDDDDASVAEVERTEVDGAREGHRGGKLARLDADKDGVITLAEAKGSRLERRFVELDADKDGRLTREEMAAMKRHGGEGRGFRKDPAKRAEMLLGKLDADKDGAISKAEVDGSRFAAKFAEVDTNGDTRVTREELIAFRPVRGVHERAGDERRAR